MDAFVLSRKHFAEFGQAKSAGNELPQLVELLETSRTVSVRRPSSGSKTAGSHMIRAVAVRNDSENAKHKTIGRMVFERGRREFDSGNELRKIRK